MPEAQIYPDWQTLFPILKEQSPAMAAQFNIVTLPANQVAFHQGDDCASYLLVIRGSIKVIARHASGREIVLYRVQQGGSCVLTTSCLLGKTRYPAEGITETEVEALAIPAAVFHQGLAESESFRTFVFNTYGQRLADVISLVESINFEHIQARLARFLAEQNNNPVNITHQALATELGSAREVISRQLKQFEKQGLIRQQRGKIQLLDKNQLLQIAKDATQCD